jgi:hypothetical protein
MPEIGDIHESGWEFNQLENSDIVFWTHPASQCMGEYCTIHKRSNHSMRSLPQSFRWDRGLMERICTHGVGHPDPDDIKLLGEHGWAEEVHGCDGCCAETN